MVIKMAKDELMTKKDIKDIAKAIDEKVKDDYKKHFTEILLKKRKQIRMMEITLEKAKKEYEDLLSGDKVIGEEEYLFN